MIEEISQALGGVPHSVVYGLLAFAVLVFAVQLYALVDLVRRPRVLWGRKWVWALIILLVSNGIGAVLWFVLGRRVPQEEPVEAAAPSPVNKGKTSRAVDVLYGDGEK